MSSFYFSREHYEDINQLPCLSKRNILTINRKGRISKLGIIFPVINVGLKKNTCHIVLECSFSRKPGEESS